MLNLIIRPRCPLRHHWITSFIAALAIMIVANSASAFYTYGDGYGLKWGDWNFGTGATVTWGYMQDGTTVADDFRIDPWNYPDISGVIGGSNLSQIRNSIDTTYGQGSFDNAIHNAFDTWAAAANIVFVGPQDDTGLPVNDPAADQPQIRIGAFMPDPNHSFQYVGAVGFAPPPNGGSLEGDILFNLAAAFQIASGQEDVTPIDYGMGNDLQSLFLHELGHAAIGLGHPDENDPATEIDSVMYVGPGGGLNINRQLSPDDITGAQYVYGPPITLNADFNGDLVVDVIDLGILAGGWQMNGSMSEGDANRDGYVDVIDLGILAGEWQMAAGAAGNAAPVPEPAGLILLSSGLWCLARHRRITHRTSA